MSTDEIEVASVREGEELDWRSLESWLREHLEELPPQAMEVLQFPRGSANLTYRLAFGDLLLVLRRPPFGKTAPGAHDMGREHTILSKLWRAYPRAPRAWALCEDEAVIGARFVVQEYRGDGVVVFGEAPSDMAGLPNLGGRLATAMADALHELHSVDYIAVGLSDLGKPEGFVARQLSGWLDRWRRVAASDCADVMDRVAERLAREAPTVSCNAIVHNDYKLDNCQFAVGVPDEVISVFDWDMATLGDPLIDVGITLAYWSHMQRGESLGLPSRETFAALYAERAGIDAGELSWYEAFAHWRNAVAVQQLYERYVRGESQNPKLAGAGKAVATMANRAEAILENRTS